MEKILIKQEGKWAKAKILYFSIQKKIKHKSTCCAVIARLRKRENEKDESYNSER